MTYTAGAYKPQTQEELNRAQYYWETRKKSLEAYTRTIDPYCGEFERVMDELFTIRAEQERLFIIGAEISVRDYFKLISANQQPTAQP